MEYRIEYDKIMAIVEEEVSREAEQTSSADGVSLYDEIRMISRDENKKKRMMSEVLASVKAQCNRFIMRTDVSEESESEPLSFVFELDITERRSSGKGSSLQTMLRSMTVNMILSKFFRSKNLAELATKYDDLALSDVQAMAKLLYEKLPPVYPTIYE